ncbi:hypothetical protein AA313_de0205735 [Arthrobotrys entomopaga]|nr:hypothetical protein AA313_de0205735 [Arthrobotrys entomopaga]
MPEPQPPSPEVFDKYSEILHPDAFPEAHKLLKNFLTDTTIPWQSNGTKNGIDLYFYSPEVDPPLPAPICRGVGTFPEGLTAEQILPVIHQIACRRFWDERLKLGFPTLRYSRKMMRFYAVQKGVGEWVVIVKFDPKGSIPSAIISQVVKETPLCIYKVRNFIEQRGLVPHVRMHDEFPGQLRQEYLTSEDVVVNPETGETLTEAGFQFTFSWFGAVGSFDINFDEKWANGVKIDIEEGQAGEDFELKSSKGKVTVTVKEAGKDKKLKLVVSKA